MAKEVLKAAVRTAAAELAATGALEAGARWVRTRVRRKAMSYAARAALVAIAVPAGLYLGRELLRSRVG